MSSCPLSHKSGTTPLPGWYGADPTLNAEVAFTLFAQRFNDLQVDTADIEWAPSLFRIPGKIPARFAPRR